MHDHEIVSEYGSRRAWEAVFDVMRRQNPGRVFFLTPRPGRDETPQPLNGPAPTEHRESDDVGSGDV